MNMKKWVTVMALLLTTSFASFGQHIWQPRNELSITAGRNFDDDGLVTAKIDYTHYTKSNIGFGIGSGLWIFYNTDDFALPLSAHISYSYPMKHITPYVQLGVSSVLEFGDGAAGVDFFCNPAIGVKIPVSKRLALNLNADYVGGLIEGEGALGFNAGIALALGKKKSKQ